MIVCIVRILIIIITIDRCEAFIQAKYHPPSLHAVYYKLSHNYDTPSSTCRFAVWERRVRDDLHLSKLSNHSTSNSTILASSNIYDSLHCNSTLNSSINSTKQKYPNIQFQFGSMSTWMPTTNPWPVSSVIRSNSSQNSTSVPTVLLNSNVTNRGKSSAFSKPRDLDDCKTRIVKLEKAVASLNVKVSSRDNRGLGGASSRMVSALAAYPNTIQLTPGTIKTCSVATHFLMGIVLGASLLDRLWLIGGISLAWWSSDAVGRDTRGGAFARKVGVEVASQVRELQEKYRQAVIFYRTGKLAYVSSKTWERYDKMYSITQRVEAMKSMTKRRAMQFNSTLGNLGLTDQLSDFIYVMQQAPSNARELNKRYRVTRKVSNAVRKGAAQVLSIGSKGLNLGSNLLSGESKLSNRKNGKNAGWRKSPKYSRGSDKDGLIIRAIRASRDWVVNTWRVLVTGEEPILRGKKSRGWTAGGTVNPWALPFVGDSKSIIKKSASKKRITEILTSDQLVILLSILLVLELAKDITATSLKLAILR